MNREQKIHHLKVIKEALSYSFKIIIFVEHIGGKRVYLTPNRLEISEPIRRFFFKDAIPFESVVKGEHKTKDWVKIP